MKLPATLSFALLAGCTMSAGPEVAASPESERRLASALAGRVADRPVACVQQRQIRGNTPVDSGTILFTGNNGLVYVNRTRSSCAGIRPWHALRRRSIGTSICEGDLVVGFDPTSGIEYSGCTLGEFTPYRRVG